MNARPALRLALALAVAPFVAGCGGGDADVDATPPPAVTADALRVTSVDLGSAIGADKRVTAAGDEFRPTDTIHASVATEGTASNATLTARWTFEDGQVVDESTRTISPGGPAITEFHVSKPDGFPTGRYRVEILLNGTSVETKDFEVK